MRKFKVFICVMLLCTLCSLPAYASSRFTDVNSSSWYYNVVTKLVNLNCINGYPDGTFKPNNTITVEEFIKIAVTSLGYTDIKPGTKNWSKPYIDKAIEIGIVNSGEFDNYSRNINRGEMARIVTRGAEIKGENFDNLEKYKAMIADYSSIDVHFKEYVVSAYSKGIITGYPDGQFKATKQATRAEASTMIIRMLGEERANPDANPPKVVEPNPGSTSDRPTITWEDGMYIPNDTSREYAKKVMATVAIDKAKNTFSFTLPLAPEGTMWDINLNYKNKQGENTWDLFGKYIWGNQYTASKDPRSVGGQSFTFNIPYNNIQKGNFVVGLVRESYVGDLPGAGCIFNICQETWKTW